jgi:hypothetical protein
MAGKAFMFVKGRYMFFKGIFDNFVDSRQKLALFK